MSDRSGKVKLRFTTRKENKVSSFNASQDMLDAIEELAVMKGLSKSQVIRGAIREYVYPKLERSRNQAAMRYRRDNETTAQIVLDKIEEIIRNANGVTYSKDDNSADSQD